MESCFSILYYLISIPTPQKRVQSSEFREILKFNGVFVYTTEVTVNNFTYKRKGVAYMTKYKKSDLVEHLAGKFGLPKKQVEDLVEGILDYITGLLKKRDELTLTGFGTFLAKDRKGRMGINPKNPSQKVQIPPSTVPRFKAGKGLKDAVKNN